MNSTSNLLNGTHASPHDSESSSTQPQGPTNAVGHRRIFVGPMPERVISHTETQTSQKRKMTLGSVFSLTQDHQDRPSGGDKTEEIARLVKAHAFKYFLHQGGDEADWDENQEESTVDELMKRWKESEWGRLWSSRHDRRRKREGFQALNAGSPQWFGTSFEVGKLLGVDVFQGHDHIHARSAHSSLGVVPPAAEDAHADSTHAPTSPSSAHFQTTTSRTEAGSSMNSHYESAPASPVHAEDSRDDFVADEATPASSITGLLRHKTTGPDSVKQKAKSHPNLGLTLSKPPEDVNRTQSDMPPSAILKGKAKMVHYEIAPLNTNVEVSSSADQPAPPEQVLKRKRSSLAKNTSSAATVEADLATEPPTTVPKQPAPGDTVLRDRMLVRVCHTKDEGITHFDEEINRTTRDLKYEDWAEFLVAWRRDSIEIYRDHNTPGKEWMTGRKHLSYVIPLLSSKTKLSLFSFVDLTFCLTCAPTTTRLNPETSRWNFSREKEGTNVFVFKVKSRSRAYDWIWKLWRAMGGQTPPVIDIYNPRLDAKVKINIPETDPRNFNETFPTFTRKNVIQLCMDSLHDVADWKYLMDEQLKKGYSLELAWRSTTNLDWIWLEGDVMGKPREWNVLCGLPLRQLASKPPNLEIRLAFHGPTDVRLKNGKRFEEPPSIEGYLDRIRPNTQTKQSVYLSVHQGHLFLLNPFTAHPPMPPGLNPIGTSSLDGQLENLRHAEIRRGTNQIMGANAVLDLRAIIAVRRAFHITPLHTHDHKVDRNEDAMFANFMGVEPLTTEDQEDAGGEAGLVNVQDRARARTRRSFELLLKTGHVLRFEAYSCRIAIEWIVRLRALIFYWKQRHRLDAKQEIELAQAQKPRLTPQTRAHRDDEQHPPNHISDLSSLFAAMDSLYNWCILEGCKPVVKGGRLYMKKGLRGQYKLVQLCLIAGHLVRFRISGTSSLYPAMRKKFNLLDAYVYSGYLAEQCLPKGQYNPNVIPPPRRYQDGLETDDRDEDMMFMIWYRSQPQMFDADQDPITAPVSSRSIPSISAKNKVLIFKTRSILERDAWCWAINSEIEKIVRTQKAREEKMRETGNLVSLT